MSQDKLFVRLISSLTDSEFDKVAKLYLIEVDGISDVINCNGPYDSGIDMRKADFSKTEVQYQITTIKENRFENKLYGDLAKAKKNVVNSGLPAKVKYFYSYPLTSAEIIKYQKAAKENYGLILTLIEANSISGIAEQYEKIRSLLINFAGLDNYTGGSDFFEDSKVKAFYDLMSFGSSNDIKYNIIKSFVLYYLYSSNQPITENDLLIAINKHFKAEITSAYFGEFCRKLKSEKRIESVQQGKLFLTEIEKNRINDVLEKYQLEETVFRKELHDLLKEYKLEKFVEEMIVKLIELYEGNFSINLSEFTKKNATVNDLKTTTINFTEYLRNKLNDPIAVDGLIKRLFEISDKYEILSRIAAGQVYSKVSDPDRLEDYITRHNNNKEIFLDTNVVIQALCLFYENTSTYQDKSFKIVRHLLDFVRKNNLHLKTLKGYAIETINLFKDALNIIPFTKLKVFDDLGGSKNVLYKFYSHLKTYDELHDGTESFEQFLKEFKFDIKKGSDYNYMQQIETLLDGFQIEVETPPMYDSNDLNKVKAIIISDLRDNDRNKSAVAISNDGVAMLRLGDPDTDINPMDPIFCTMDLSMWRVRKKYLDEFPRSSEWLLYTPSSLIDHYSMMNFQVKQGTLTNEVLSLLDEDFGFQEKTQSLLDSMLTIINPENSVGLLYTNKLAELRKSEILQVDQKPEGIPEDNYDSNSVDIIFKNLFVKYATKKEEEGIFDSFKTLFTKEEYFTDVFNLLSNEVKVVNYTGKVSDQFFISFDKIIESSIKSK